MQLEAWVSVASVVSASVAVVAAGVAVWQARAAGRQAKAAEDQVEIMRRQHEANEAERRNRENAQATLVTIEVGYSPPVVTITNDSEQQVRRLRIKSIINAPVRWGIWVHELDMDGEECEVGYKYGGSEEYVLQPHTRTSIPYQYFDEAGGRTVPDNVFNERILVDYVTITFDMSGVRWRLTGDGEPIRVGVAPG
jgi:hypothetical protein